MYKRILVAVEHSPADRTILTHVTALAKLTGAELLLVHVADGFAARNFDRLKLRESEEMKADRAYLEDLKASLAAEGLAVSTQLALGDPAQELIRAAGDGDVDLIAMSTHGHASCPTSSTAPPPTAWHLVKIHGPPASRPVARARMVANHWPRKILRTIGVLFVSRGRRFPRVGDEAARRRSRPRERNRRWLQTSKVEEWLGHRMQGDFKTLLAFNLASRRARRTWRVHDSDQPKGKAAYFLFNSYQFETPTNHTQVATDPPNSSINAPIHKFRWVHYPGSFHQGVTPAIGSYTYTVTPRFFDSNQSLLPIDPSRSVSVTIDVEPFVKKNLEVGFARGFTQSQAFVHHFGKDAIIRRAGSELLFDTKQVSGTGPDGKPYTFEEEYDWLGFTARVQIFAVLNEVLDNTNLRLDVCAYDLKEPDIMDAFLTLAKQGRIRIILDNAGLHHNATTPKPEDEFETKFIAAAKTGASIVRGKFGRYAHDKLLIVSNKTGAVKVLTGSTNFSVTGVYVNSNHVLVFNDKKASRCVRRCSTNR